jgi:predicted RNase H-like HicB family nuclease
MSRNFQIAVLKEDDMYVAYALENNVASQGYTEEEAISNLREALELYYEDNEARIFLPEVKIRDLRVSI